MLSKPAPCWQGIPPEVKFIVVKKLNVLDRCNFRNVARQERKFADRSPYEIHNLNIIASTEALKITIHETEGYRFDLPAETQVSDLVLLLKKAELKIGKLSLLSGVEPFGERLQTLALKMEQNGILRNSLQIKKFRFHTNGMDHEEANKDKITQIPELAYFLELCKPEDLTYIIIDSRLTENVFRRLTETAQWRNSEYLHFRKGQKFNGPYFDEWNGRRIHLQIQGEPGNALRDQMIEIFKKKPIECGFFQFYWYDAPYIRLIKKFAIPEDPTKVLDIFFGPCLIAGVVNRLEESYEVGKVLYNPDEEPKELD